MFIGAQQIQQQYIAIRSDCIIVTACDSKHAPFLFNALASCRDRFPDHPKIVVFDLGLTNLQKRELSEFDEVSVRDVAHFVPHWRLNWSWKLHAMTSTPGRYVLYLDLPNFVVLRGLAAWFLTISRCGYLLVENGQRLGDITPEDYWAAHGLDPELMREQVTFGAGLVGFDREKGAYKAITQSYERVVQGLNLGRSRDEPSKNYQPAIIRDCACFRADQTLLNLAFREIFGEGLQIRRRDLYTGRGAVDNHPNQFLWYARRQRGSLRYIYTALGPVRSAFLLNRIAWAIRLSAITIVKRLLSR